MRNPKFKKFAPIFIGLGIFGLVMVVMFNFILSNSHASDISPTGVTVSDITENSAKISWTSNQSVQCVIQYNSSVAAVSTGSFAPETTKTSTHSIDITLLAPDTTYYYNFSCNGQNFDNNGAPYSFRTITVDKKTPSLNLTPQVPLPTSLPTSAVPLPTAPTAPISGCSYTDCSTIKANVGKTCTIRDYIIKCVNTTPTPTLQPAPKYLSPTPKV